MLFVAEKRAAIDAVLERLDAEGLGHIVMDLHRRAQSRRLIAQDLQAALETSITTAAVDASADQAVLVARRDRLNRYTGALHRRRDPWGVTLAGALQSVAGTDPAARLDFGSPRPHWRPSTLTAPPRPRKHWSTSSASAASPRRARRGPEPD